MAVGSDELRWAERIKRGDVEAFASLVEKYRRPLVRFLYRMVHDAAIAEELAQEAFLRVYRARGRYRPFGGAQGRPRAKFSTWLFKIATNLALNSLRDGRSRERHGISAALRLRREVEEGREEAIESVADPRPTMEQRLVESERLGAVRQAVEELPEKQRLAVVLHKYEELNYAEIADILGCSESALKSLLFRAYETLRGKLKPLLGVRA